MLTHIAVVALFAIQIAVADFPPLLSDDAPTRTAASEGLAGEVEKRPELLRDESVHGILIAALERENTFLQLNLNAVASGRPPIFDEGYGEHYSRVLELVNRLRGVGPIHADHRRRALRALVLGAYNPGSAFSRDLASEGEALVPFVLEAVESPIGPTRWNGYELIADLWRASDSGAAAPLAAATRQSLQAAARRGLEDPVSDVRLYAISAVIATGDTGALPLLMQLAASTPDDQTDHWVRTRAQEAVRILRASP